MSSAASVRPSRAGVAIRAILAIIGIGLVAYAVSDHPLYGGGTGFGTVQMLLAAFGLVLLIGSALPRSIADRLLLVAISLLAMVGVGELAVSTILGSSLRPIYQYDDRLIFKLVPDSEGELLLPPVNGGETITHRINSAGFRGPELSTAADKRRIVVYGDSFIHAPYTREPDTFVRQLETQLSAKLRQPIEVVNAGVSSYGPDQIALRMADDIKSLDPDLLVVAIFAGNDFGDLIRNKMFLVGEGGSLAPNDWTLAEDVRRNFELGQSESLLLKALKRAWGVLRASTGDQPSPDQQIPSLESMLEISRAEYRDYVVDRNNVVTNTHVDYYSADVSLEPGSDSARFKTALMQLVMGRIAEQARDAGVPLVFLFIPHPADLMPEWEWGRVDLSRYPAYAGRNQIAALESGATALGAGYVSLFDAFRGSDPASLYLRGGDDHWNSAGQRFAAGQAAEYILQARLID